MSLLDLPERLLQRAAQRLLSDGGRTWTCTNGDSIQILSTGLLNPHEGPDFTRMAVLNDGIVHVGNSEFHVHSSAWFHHGHENDERYDDVLLHIVLVHDRPTVDVRWTLVLPLDDIERAIRTRNGPVEYDSSNVDEIQRSAMLRLYRATAFARSAVGRVGPVNALQVLTSHWFDRLSSKRRHPMPNELVQAIRMSIAGSPIGILALNIATVPPGEILMALEHAERARIISEGAALRREIVVNIILPLCCALADEAQRVVLLQWYWSVKAVHPYGLLYRRFPQQDQTYVWQQQGMLEWLRQYG
ncbi:MAG: DUF2851 family protein [Candidatus Kapabacteria bacterium]|nr:DUF2851 family protein [Candidatus Kapabacteria bacterium]